MMDYRKKINEMKVPEFRRTVGELENASQGELKTRQYYNLDIYSRRLIGNNSRD
jgi:hypothetical protein